MIEPAMQIVINCHPASYGDEGVDVESYIGVSLLTAQDIQELIIQTVNDLRPPRHAIVEAVRERRRKFMDDNESLERMERAIWDTQPPDQFASTIDNFRKGFDEKDV
jgi:hypothetical protein